MLILFPSIPGQAQDIDPAYRREMVAAQEAGFETAVVDIDTPYVGCVPECNGETAIYRGWMVTPNQYAELYHLLWKRGVKLINEPDEYRWCHELPRWYPDFEKLTPKSIWFPSESFDSEAYFTPPSVLTQILAEVPEKLGPGPYIVKDYVKSRKHEWDDACFIKDLQDIRRVVTNFVERQGDDLAGGLVFRKFQPLRRVGEHPKSGIPIFNEARIFGVRGQELATFPYWGPEEGGGLRIETPLDPLTASLLWKVKSNFFTVDIGLLPASYGPYTDSKSWVVIELGDAQVAGLPEHVNIEKFYYYLRRRFV